MTPSTIFFTVAIAIASFGILFTLAVDQVAMYFMNRLNYSTVPPHLGLIKEHGCEGGKWPDDIELGQEHNTRSHHHEEHKHSVEGTIDGSIVSGPADKSIGVSDYDHHVAVKGQEWARTNTVEEDKEINGHSHRHLHVTHDCDVLGKIFVCCSSYYYGPHASASIQMKNSQRRSS